MDIHDFIDAPAMSVETYDIAPLNALGVKWAIHDDSIAPDFYPDTNTSFSKPNSEKNKRTPNQRK
jgi:hypothetical protein